MAITFTIYSPGESATLESLHALDTPVRFEIQADNLYKFLTEHVTVDVLELVLWRLKLKYPHLFQM